ncbi:MAG: hypothetical protein ACI87W_002951 [Halieaceae bacterium]|jgi:hypothetical protein
MLGRKGFWTCQKWSCHHWGTNRLFSNIPAKQVPYSNLQAYEEKCYGFSANGALIQDTLFVSFAYEKQEVPRFLAQGYDGAESGEDRASDSDDNEFEFENHDYVKGDENTTYSAFLSCQWTNNFSTDVFIGTQEQKDSQVTVGSKDFGDHQISDADRNTIYRGADDSRQANSLSYDASYLRLNAEYQFREH